MTNYTNSIAPYQTRTQSERWLPEQHPSFYERRNRLPVDIVDKVKLLPDIVFHALPEREKFDLIWTESRFWRGQRVADQHEFMGTLKEVKRILKVLKEREEEYQMKITGVINPIMGSPLLQSESKKVRKLLADD